MTQEKKTKISLFLQTFVAVIIIAGFQSGVMKERSERIENREIRDFTTEMASRWDDFTGLSPVRDSAYAFKDNLISSLDPATVAEDIPNTVFADSSNVQNAEPQNEAPTAANAVIDVEQPRSVLTAGDSMMGEIAYAMRRMSKTDGYKFADAHKASTGLSNPNYYDWKKELPTWMEKHNPNVVVFMVGANDAQDMRESETGKWVRFGTDGWKTEYAKRIEKISKIVTAHGAKLYWIGVPPMRSPEFDRKMRIIQSVYSEKAADGGFELIETESLLGKNGSFTKDLDNEKGKRASVRADDGIHLTVFGGEIIAKKVSERMTDKKKA